MIELLAVSDATILAIAQELFAMIETVLMGIVAFYLAKLNGKANTVVSEAKEAKTTLAIQTQVMGDKLDGIRDATDVTNVMLSSQGGKNV